MSGIDPAQYDTFADEYQVHAAASPYNALYDRPATLRLLGDVAGRRVLDLGCGPGFYAEELVRRGARVVGCDAAQRMVELARERLGTTAEFRVHSLEEPLSWLGDDTVDVVLCALALHCVTDRLGLLREAKRVLAPGGCVVISTHHPMADWIRLGGSYFESQLVTETWSTGWEVSAWRLPLTTLTEEFADAGFAIERLIEPQPDPAMADSAPRTFEKLSTRPNFLLVRLTAR